MSQEHSLQLVENLRKIYYEEDCFLHDITLCSKDSGEVKAHKIILAAQSQYFKVNIVNKYLFYLYQVDQLLFANFSGRMLKQSF